MSDTVEFLHVYLIQPMITPEDRITHAIHFLVCAFKDVPSTLCDSQLATIVASDKLIEKKSADYYIHGRISS